MQGKKIVKAICCLIPVIVGTYLSVKDYVELQNHPEWSVSPSVIWIKFGLGLIISIILLLFVFKQKN